MKSIISCDKSSPALWVMKYAVAALTAFCSFSAWAYDLPAGTKAGSVIGIEVNDISLSDNGDINVQLALDLSKVSMKSNFETIYTPMFINGNDTLRFGSFAVTGRNRLYSDRRNDTKPDIIFYKGKANNYTVPVNGITLTSQKVLNPAAYDMKLSTHYREWMQTAVFTIGMETRGCANCVKKIDGETEQWLPIAQNDFVTRTFMPEFLYVTPVAEAVKMREIAARAYIDFPVNRTEIYPDYRRNPQELGKIRATIDSVRNDKDITVKSLHISGTASPEGSYQNNVRLAKGRTEALKNYVQMLYNFPAGFITTSYEPVDWKGLREFLEGSATDSIRIDQLQNIVYTRHELDAYLPNRLSILNIVNGSVEDYQRNQNIKNNYPKEYQWLLTNVYPALRHSDYRIQFEIKSFTEAEEIIEVMQTQPQKLSLNELFVAANSQPEGSELYNRAFEIAVTMFPNDETANLNAATNALIRGDLVSAEKYLAKAGNSTEAAYNRAMMYYLQGDTGGALLILEDLARGQGLAAEKALKSLEAIREIKISNDRKFIRL